MHNQQEEEKKHQASSSYWKQDEITRMYISIMHIKQVKKETKRKWKEME